MFQETLRHGYQPEAAWKLHSCLHQLAWVKEHGCPQGDTEGAAMVDSLLSQQDQGGRIYVPPQWTGVLRSLPHCEPEDSGLFSRSQRMASKSPGLLSPPLYYPACPPA